ncbi:MAG: hypothetical protein HPY76_15090, partial [Anaerolineae bacterium]|nr:hypothetical protein [Anaerolineae bacterium]
QRKPDFGPSKLGSAGATVIGARHPLVDYNIYLNTGDVALAQKIARAIRYSSGGFRYVKAMGILVDGLAQVSMNLTNFRNTPIARVQEAVRREAQAYGVTLHHAELVGLVPQDAIVSAAQWYLQLTDFSADQILENNLQPAPAAAVVPDEQPDLLDRLASAAPTPGGGSAGAHVGAVAAALVTMVARLTIGKKNYAAVEGDFLAMIEKSEALRSSLTQSVAADARSFDSYMQALKFPKESPDQVKARSDAIAEASLGAASVPFDVAKSSLQVLEMALFAAQHGNINAISDAGSAGAFAFASFQAAVMNVRINLSHPSRQPRAQAMLNDIEEYEKVSLTLKDQLDQILKTRGGL